MAIRSDITITVGGATAQLMLERDPETERALYRRSSAPPLNPIINSTGELDFNATPPESGVTRPYSDFSLGCGAFYHEEVVDPRTGRVRCRYAIGDNVDTRWGFLLPGPREVADLSGIDSGYYPMRRVFHGSVSWLLTNNGTNTKVYRVEAGAWVLKETINSNIGTDMVSYKGDLAVCFGTGRVWRYTSNDGTSWSDDTRYANYFCVSSFEGNESKVWYVTNPNELYSTTDISGGSSSTASTIGDTEDDEFNSLVEQRRTGVLLIAKRHMIWTINSAGRVRPVTTRYRYIAVSDDGSSTPSHNFRIWEQIGDYTYYRVEDYRIIAVTPDEVIEDLQPGAFGPQIHRMQLPINAMANVNGELWVAIGTTTPSSIRDMANMVPSDGMQQGSFFVTSEIYAGRYQDDGHGGPTWAWHGVLLRITGSIARYMWFDDNETRLYIAKFGQVQTRALVSKVNPITVLSSGTVYLSSATWVLETGLITNGYPNIDKTLRKAVVQTGVLASSTPSLQVLFRIANDDVNTAFSSLVTYTSASTARTGTAFPTGMTYRGARFQFKGAPTASPSTAVHYAIMYGSQITHLFYPPAKDMITMTFKAVNNVVLSSGARSVQSWAALKAFLTTWQDATDPATITDNETGDTWSMRLENFTEDGLGRDRLVQLVGREVI